MTPAIATSLLTPNTSLVSRQHRPGLHVVRTGLPECCYYDFSLFPLPNESFGEMLLRLKSQLLETKAVPVLQFAFGSAEKLACGTQLMERVFGKAAWPVLWAEGAPALGGEGVAGIQVIAVSQRPIKRITHQNQVIACIFEDGNARHCLSARPIIAPSCQKPEETDKAIGELEQVLQQNGFGFDEVVRTWFYLDDILAWYGDFNSVRNALYSKHLFRVGSLPASTGVAARNPLGSALSFAAWAVQPLGGSEFPVQEVFSPLQGPAASYGSSFSRAVEIQLSRGRRLLVSGTASILPDGKTTHVGDIRQQIDLSMEVVAKILQSRGMSFANTTRASVYLKNPEFAGVFSQWCADHRCQIPGLLIHCDICRDDLLFEIELDAVSE